MLNLFAYRATDPKKMKNALDPVGGSNDHYLLKIAKESHLVVAAWGTHGVYRGRDKEVLSLLAKHDVEVHCLGLTKGGHPKHPLYLRADTERVLLMAGEYSE